MRAAFLSKRGEATAITIAVIVALMLFALFKPTITGLITGNETFTDNLTLTENISPEETAPVEELPAQEIANTAIMQVKDYKNSAVEVDVELLGEKTIKNGKEVQRLKIKPRQHVIKEIDVKDANIVSGAENLIRIDDAPEESAGLQGAVEVYAIDPTRLDFTEATVTVTATGDALYKCKDWNFDQQTCAGEWLKLMDIVPGEDYSFILTPQDPGYGELRAQTCVAEDGAVKGSFGGVCDGTYPTACGVAPTGDLLSCNDANVEIHTLSGGYSGLKISQFNSSLTNCSTINEVYACYEWWTDTNSPTDCDVSVDNQNGTNFTAITTVCPGNGANPGIMCVNVTALKNWSCSNFFGASGTRAQIKSESSRTGGGTKSTYWDVLYYNVTSYTATVSDLVPPNWTNAVSFPTSPATYSPTASYQLNTTWTDNIAVTTVLFETNFTGTPANSSATGNAGSVYYYNYALPLAAGTYYWKSWASDAVGNRNVTSVQSYTVNKASSTLSLAITPSTTVNYGTITTANCTASTTQITPQLFRNGTSVGGSYETTTIGVGSYNYSCNATTTQNYTAPTAQSSVLTVNKASTTTQLYLNGAQSNLSINYPAQVNATATTSMGTVQLYRNGTLVASGNPAINITTLAVGSYNYTAINTGNGNYSGSSETWFLTINKAASSINLLLNGAASNITVERKSSVNKTATLVTPTTGAVQLYEQETLITSGNSPLTNISTYNNIGLFNITASYPATQNYTTSSISRFVTVQDTTPPATVTGLANQSQTAYSIYWTWTNPINDDFNHTEIWINGIWQTNLSAPTNYYNATGIIPSTNYTIQTRTVDNYGIVNQTWVNNTATTQFAPDLTMPVIGVINPPANAVDVDGNIIFNGSATDNANLANISLYFMGALNQTAIVSGLSANANFSISSLANGNYNWYFRVCDSASNCNNSETRSLVVSIPAAPIYTNFTGQGNTTNWTAVPDITNVCNGTAILDQPSTDKIAWPGCVNASAQNFDVNVILSYNNVTVISSGLNPTFNSTATITIRNLPWDAPPNVYMDGALCFEPDCSNVSYSNGTAVFNVSHFTSIITGTNSQLVIWDETDAGMAYADKIRYKNEQITFFANYTRTSNGNFISGATCNINFTDTGAITMAENATISLYQYNRSFASPGAYFFSVICSKGGSNTLSTTDNTTVTADTIVPYWTNNRTFPLSPTTYSPTETYQFNITWTDNIALDAAYFEHNFTGTPVNYSPTGFVGNLTNKEYYYNYGALAAGTYYWKSWANDTSDNWNFTNSFSYVVDKTASEINLTLNGFDANITVNQYTISNITANIVTPTTGAIEIYQNGTLINSGQSLLTNLTNYTIAPAIYNITAVYPATQNYTSSFETHFLTVSEVDLQAPNWTNAVSFPTSPATYSPTASYQLNTTWTDNFALGTVLFEHNFTGTAANYTASGSSGSVYYYNYGALPAGTYYWKSWASDAVGNWNSTSAQSYVVNKASSTLSLAINPSTTVNYSTITTANCTASTPQITPQLFKNGTFVGASYETMTLAAGSYNYSCNATATQNYTAPAEQSSILTVNQAATTTQLYLNGARSNLTVAYPTITNATAATSIGTVQLYRNGANVTSQNGQLVTLAANAIPYNYTAVNSGNANYSGSSETWFVTVNQAASTLSLALTPSSNVTYPTATTANCTASTPQITPLLYRNGTLVAGAYESSTLAAGSYSYVCNATATENYSAPAPQTNNLIINKAASSINLLLNNIDANTSAVKNTQVNITAALISPAADYIEIYENGALLDSGSSPRTVLKTYNSTATHNLTAVYPATENYSSSFETHFLEIIAGDTTTPTITSYSAKPRAVSIGKNVTVNATATDNVAVNAIWAVIIKPDTTTTTVTLTSGNAYYAPTLAGRHNITFYANDSSGNNATSATDYFIAAAPLNYTISVIDANSTDVYTNLSIYFAGTNEEIDFANFTGTDTVEEPNYIFDLLFSSYSDELQARLNSVNLSANNNLTLGMDRLPTPVTGYIGSYALNKSSFSFTTADLRFSYAGMSYANEAYLKLYVCADWNFANRICSGAFALASGAVQNTAGDYFTLAATDFSGFSIKDETPPSGEGGGGGGTTTPPPATPPIIPPPGITPPAITPPAVPPAITPPAVEQPAEIVPTSIEEIVPGTTLAVAPEIAGKVSCGFITNAVSAQIKANAVDASVLRLIKIPAGYEMIDQFKLDCSGDNLEVTLNLPEGYTDVKALGCRAGECTEVEGIVNRNSMICGGKTIGELINQKITKIKEIINPEEFAVLQSQSKTITSQSKMVFSGKNSVEFTGEIPSELTATLNSPKTAVPAPKNYGALIMGTPLVLQLSKRTYSNAIAVTMPILDAAGFEQDSLEIYALQNNEWSRVNSAQDKAARTITAQIEDISSYLNFENKITFAVIGVKCKACAVANFDRLYDGAGARNALVLVPGLFADEHPFGPLIEELSYNSQPWQIWRFMYPTSLTVDEIAKQLSNSLESHAGEYDSITLIGHSLGGIIEQRALVDAKDRQLEWLAKVGKVVLVGTPNDGSPAKEIYSRLFNSLMNLDTAAKLFDINSDIIQTITQPQQMPVVEGLDYQVIAGIRSYDFTADLFAAGQKNDGVITTTSAQHIGDDYINNSCSDYYEINITHTDLNDNPVAVRVLERIINKDLASQNANKVYVGYNQYFKIAVTGCSSEDVYVLIGKKINAEKAPDPINCNCGNGWCGEGETADNCPVDCARPVTTESICLFLPIVTYIPVIIFVVLLGIAGLMRISKKKQDERSHNKSVRLKKPLAVFAAIALAISLYQYVTCKELTLISIIVNALKLPFATTTTLVIAIAAVATVLLLIFIRYFGKHAQYAIHRKEVHALKIRQQRLERLNAILDRRIQMHLEKKEEK